MSESFIICSKCKSKYDQDRFLSIFDKPIRCIDCNEELFSCEEIYNCSNIKFSISKSNEYYFEFDYDIELLFDKLVEYKKCNSFNYMSILNKLNIYLLCLCYLLCFYDNQYKYMFTLQILYYDLFMYKIAVWLLNFKYMLVYVMLLNLMMFSFIIKIYFGTLIDKIFALQMLMFYLFSVMYYVNVFINVIKISFFRCFYYNKLDDFISLFLKKTV